jgi:hypothetical protein
MKLASAIILSTVICGACSAPTDPPYQGSSGGDPNRSGSSASGSATSETGDGTSGVESQSSGNGATGASTGRVSSGAISTGSSRTGSVGGGTGTASGRSGSSTTTGTSTGAASGGSTGGGIGDAGDAHRDAAPVELTGCAEQVPTAIFGASCEESSCHNSKDHIYGLDLQSPGVAERLVDVPSFEIPTLFLIDPNDWMQSYILLKVEKSMPPAGTQMPQMGAKLTATQIGCLQQWVEAEAAGPY